MFGYRNTEFFFFDMWEGLLKKPFFGRFERSRPQWSPFLLGRRRGVLGDSLCAFGHGVLGKLAGQQESYSGLYLSAGDGLALVVVSKTRSFSGNSFEDVVDEGVHDGHALGADPGVGVDLLQDLVDVDRVRFLPLLLAFLTVTGGTASLLTGFLFSFLSCDWRHVYDYQFELKKSWSR